MEFFHGSSNALWTDKKGVMAVVVVVMVVACCDVTDEGIKRS